jgi:hypothetical protein
MTRNGYFIRLGLSIAIDLIDLTLGRIPILGTAYEGVSSIALFFLWGPAGLANLWEVADITDQFDAFIPTATLIGLYIGWKNGFLFNRGGDAVDRPQPR